MSRDIFLTVFGNKNFLRFKHIWLIVFFGKLKKPAHNRGGGMFKSHQILHGGEEVVIKGQKKCYVWLEWPLSNQRHIRSPRLRMEWNCESFYFTWSSADFFDLQLRLYFRSGCKKWQGKNSKSREQKNKLDCKYWRFL